MDLPGKPQKKECVKTWCPVAKHSKNSYPKPFFGQRFTSNKVKSYKPITNI